MTNVGPPKGGRTNQRTNGDLSHRLSSTGTPQSDGTLNKTSRIKIRYYRQINKDRPDPIVHHEELPEETYQFRFL